MRKAMETADDRAKSTLSRVAIAAMIAAMYVAALFLPVVKIILDEDRPDGIYFSGLDAVQMGWTTIALIPQLANVALALGLLAFLSQKYKLAKLIGITSFLLALTAPYIFEVHLTDLRIAFYLWLLCPIMLFIAAVALSRVSNPPHRIAAH